MEGFKWGHNFIEMNEEYLDRYQQCKDSEEIKATEELIKSEIETNCSERANDDWDPFDLENGGNINQKLNKKCDISEEEESDEGEYEEGEESEESSDLDDIPRNLN